jgi:hypothetical protein
VTTGVETLESPLGVRTVVQRDHAMALIETTNFEGNECHAAYSAAIRRGCLVEGAASVAVGRLSSHARRSSLKIKVFRPSLRARRAPVSTAE